MRHVLIIPIPNCGVLVVCRLAQFLIGQFDGPLGRIQPFELVSWLRNGMTRSIQGESDEAKRAQSKLLLKWGGLPMMVKSLTGPNGTTMHLGGCFRQWLPIVDMRCKYTNSCGTSKLP